MSSGILVCVIGYRSSVLRIGTCLLECHNARVDSGARKALYEDVPLSDLRLHQP